MTAPQQIIYVVDDDEAMRDSMTWLLEGEGYKVACFDSAAAFLGAWRSSLRGCIVLDVRMPEMSGLELQEKLDSIGSHLPIIFLTGHGDVPMAVRALKKGALDFIEKPHESERLVLAVLNALRIDREKHQAERRRREVLPDLAVRLTALSEREREVLERILDAESTRAIADALHSSVKTVEFHRARIREKLGVATQAQLFSLFIAGEGNPGI